MTLKWNDIVENYAEPEDWIKEVKDEAISKHKQKVRTLFKKWFPVDLDSKYAIEHINGFYKELIKICLKIVQML